MTQTKVDTSLEEVIRERDALRWAVKEIREVWNWWQADSYDRDASVVEDAISDAENIFNEVES